MNDGGSVLWTVEIYHASMYACLFCFTDMVYYEITLRGLLCEGLLGAEKRRDKEVMVLICIVDGLSDNEIAILALPPSSGRL